MMPDETRAVCGELKKMGIDYIVVGGASIELHYGIGTQDVDVAISMKEFKALPGKLGKNPRFRAIESLGTMTGAEFLLGTKWIDVEFINPLLFSGTKKPDEFIRYVKNYRSKKTAYGPTADASVVWYMRLAVPDWEIYLQKILRDARAGADPSILDDALTIAKAFGTEEKLKPRAQKARQLIRQYA